MKKKIINGILMVALVAATSTSFVSCKDTSEDVKTDLMAQVNTLKADLTPRVEKAEKDIQNLNDSITTHRTELNGLHDDVAELKGRVDSLEFYVDSLEDVTKNIEYRLDTIENRIGTIVDALRHMVTSVTVNATSTNMLQNSKLFPGLNLQFLGAAYGKAENSFTFPSTSSEDYIAGHGVVLTKDDIKAADGAISEEYKGYLPIAEEGAGTVWFTINPSNIDATDAESLTLSLVNSQNKASFVELGKVEQDTMTELEWGLTRADGDDFQPRLWKSEATIDFSKAKANTIDPTELIDFATIKEQVRTLFSNAYHSAADANRENYAETAKSASKTLIKDAAQIVATLLQTEIPGMPALALKAEWKDTVGTRSVLSDYSIAATAYKPLSFGFGAELGIQGRTFSFDKIDNLAARIIDKVKSKVPTITSFEVKSINFADQVVNLTTPAGTVTIPFSDLNATINTAIPVAELNNAIQSLLKVTTDVKSYADRAKNFEVRVSDFLERQLNRVIAKIAEDGLTRVLEPVMLFQGSNGVNRLSSGASFKAGEYDLIPTTMTYEVIAPAYKKYVAVIGKDGKARTAEIKTNGQKNFKKFTVELQEGDQAIVYDALDFSGKQIAKKYAINVVK